MIVVIIQVDIYDYLCLMKKMTKYYLDEENCECRCMPGTFRCAGGPCLPMVII